MNGNDLKQALKNIRAGADLLEGWTTDEDAIIDRLQTELEQVTAERDSMRDEFNQALERLNEAP
jgi:hypothetical protein